MDPKTEQTSDKPMTAKEKKNKKKNDAHNKRKVILRAEMEEYLRGERDRPIGRNSYEKDWLGHEWPNQFPEFAKLSPGKKRRERVDPKFHRENLVKESEQTAEETQASGSKNNPIVVESGSSSEEDDGDLIHGVRIPSV